MIRRAWGNRTLIFDTITCGDCVHVMADMPDDSVDLTITSPPYDDMRTYNGYKFDYTEIISQLYRITKQGGVCVWVVADQTKNGNESGTSFRQALAFQNAKWNLYHTMIYQKGRRQVGTPAGAYFKDFEFMFIFTKGMPKTYNAIQDVKNAYGFLLRSYDGERTRDGKPVKKTSQRTQEYGKRGRIWYYSQGRNQGIANEHPAIFPERLAADHITTWSNKGDLIFDPMCGSGTVLKMAKSMGRKYIGIDISQAYCDLSARRIAAIQEVLT